MTEAPAPPMAIDAFYHWMEGAKSYVDNGHKTGWRPSALMKLLVAMLATSDKPRAEQAAGEMVATSRDRWKHGFSGNPLGDEPTARAA